MAHCIFFKKKQIKIRKSREINVFSTIIQLFETSWHRSTTPTSLRAKCARKELMQKLAKNSDKSPIKIPLSSLQCRARWFHEKTQNVCCCKALFRVQTLAVCGIFSLGISLSHLSTALKLVCVLFTYVITPYIIFPFSAI